MPRHPEPIARRSPLTLLCHGMVWVLTLATLLSGCALLDLSPQPATPGPTTSEVAPTPVPEESAPAAPVVLVPDGSATDNLPVFAAVAASVWGSDQRTAGRAYVDALVAAGFDKAAMQVTADRTTIGNEAESIQFSVRWGGECLLGQVGAATGEPVVTVAPGLADGRCLIGQTRPIDW